MAHRLFRKILVAHDGSDPAERAFAKALALASLSKAELHVISVGEGAPRFAGTMGEVDEYKHQMEEYFGKLGKRLETQAAKEGATAQLHVVYGHEVESIVTFAKKHKCDLLVIGVVGHSNMLKKLMGNWGSTAQNLARLSPCTVLIVK